MIDSTSGGKPKHIFFAVNLANVTVYGVNILYNTDDWLIQYLLFHDDNLNENNPHRPTSYKPNIDIIPRFHHDITSNSSKCLKRANNI